MHRHLACLIALLALIVAPAVSLTPLSDFESAESLDAWTLRSQGQDRLERSAAFATSGVHSLLFFSPKWHQGMQEWPAFELKPPVADWTSYDRLMLDLTNPSGSLATLKLFVSDSDTEFRQGASQSFTVQPKSSVRAIIPLSKFPKQVNRADIAILHFFTTRPSADMTVHLDTIALLKPGEAPPQAPRTYLDQVVALVLDEGSVDRVAARLEEARKDIGGLEDDEAARMWAGAELDAVEQDLGTLRGELTSPKLALERIGGVRTELGALASRIDRLDHIEALR